MFECDNLIFSYLFFFSLYVVLIINWNSHKLSFNEIFSLITLPLPPLGIQSPALKPVLLLAKVAQPVKLSCTGRQSHDSCHDSMSLVSKVRVFWAKLKLQKHGKIPISVWAVFFLYFDQLKPCCTWYCCVFVRGVRGRGDGRFWLSYKLTFRMLAK